MSRREPTFVGQVQSVTGAVVGIQLRDDLQSSLRLVNGVSHRVGQIGAFLRIPLGYNQLYGVCTQVGAAAAPPNLSASAAEAANRWLSVVLFGEAIGSTFERGVSQYPTIGDEAHLVTEHDLGAIYRSVDAAASIRLGTIAAASGISANVDLPALISRHFCIVGSTGSGKSNLSTVLMRAMASERFPSTRIVMIDPHGEHAVAADTKTHVLAVGVGTETQGAGSLAVPYWALPFDEFRRISFGELTPANEAALRDEIAARRIAASKLLTAPPPENAITADSPIPFSAKQLWFDLTCRERQTYQDAQRTTPCTPIAAGNAEGLIPNVYPAAAPGNNAPFAAAPRGLLKQLDLFRSRLTDSRYSFLFNPGGGLTPTLTGGITSDLGGLVYNWVGGAKPITVIDVSSVPSEVIGTVVGTVLTVIYDTLFWASGMNISGRAQPLLVMLDEAHLVVPKGVESPAHRALRRIAKEGRKYGMGLGLVTQRPTEIDEASLSQCGTLMALRLSNKSDRDVIASAIPDDLGNLVAMLPSLRTGEGIVVGEAMPIPSRVRIAKVQTQSIGTDPALSERWAAPRVDRRPDYDVAVARWRRQDFGEPQGGPS